MKIKFWGVRGSVPVPGKSTVKYGGNTSCVSLELEDKVFIFDAGTGIRECGNYLMSKDKKNEGAIFISHTHWDHIQGFPFFVPSFIPGNKFNIYGPSSDIQNLSLKKIMEMQTSYEYFPIRIAQLGANIDYIDCREGKIDYNGYGIYSCRINHPVACFAYKIVYKGKIFVYGGDHEPYRNLYRGSSESSEMDEDFLAELDSNAAEQNKKIHDFVTGADLVSWDSQYTEEEYQNKINWGHSWHEANLKMAKEAGIKHIVLSHHDPASDDRKLALLENKYKNIAEKDGFRLDFAREKMSIEI